MGTVENHLRLSTQRVIGALGQLTIDGANLLGNVREGFVEEVGTLMHHILKVILGPSSMLAGVLKILLRRLKLVLHALKTLHSARVGCHLVELTVEGPNLLKQLLF